MGCGIIRVTECAAGLGGSLREHSLLEHSLLEHSLREHSLRLSGQAGLKPSGVICAQVTVSYEQDAAPGEGG